MTDHDTDGTVTLRAAATLMRQLGLPDGTELLSADYAPVPGEADLLGRFEVIRELGRGGMGRVVEARDPDLHRNVAVKVMIDPEEAGRAQVSRFVVEAQITSQLEHPNIVPVYDMGVTGDGLLFIAMKKVSGRSLREVLDELAEGGEAARSGWSLQRLLQIFLQICNAVAYAHTRGVIHRDLKPENVMLGEFGEVLVLDWGVARVQGAEQIPDEASELAPRDGEGSVPPDISQRTLLTGLGVAVGTPGYMSPEQARGQEVDGRSDVWALGNVLYQMLCLARPFTGANMLILIANALASDPTPPSEVAPEWLRAPGLDAVCLAALAGDPARRTASVSELMEDVEVFLNDRRRRQAAAVRLEQARGAWALFRVLTDQHDALKAEIARWEAILDPWTPLVDKAEYLEERRLLRALVPERSRAFGAVLAACHRALSQDPDCLEAKDLLADAHFTRFLEAEEAGDAAECTLHETQVRAWDEGRYRAILSGVGAVTLRTDPPGAEVVAQRYDTDHLIWPLGPAVSLGTTPLSRAPLPKGSYLLTLRAPGKRDTLYPVHIPRGHHWDGGDPVPLYTDAQIGDDFVYVPHGPFIRGGDPNVGEPRPAQTVHVDGFFMARDQVRLGDYIDFLDDLHRVDPDRAWAHVPRRDSGVDSLASRYFERPGPGGRYTIPSEADAEGDTFSLDWPALGINYMDAEAWLAWSSARRGVRLEFPLEDQWEKAARGVDGRRFPWGDQFDAALCWMRTSRPGRATINVVGACATDVSVYGVHDCAGSMREWCRCPDGYDGDLRLQALRGGSWLARAQICGCADRYGSLPGLTVSVYGFRMCRSEPLPG